MRYEIGVSNRSGKIVWANGPYPAGSFPSLKICKRVLCKKNRKHEQVLGDKGYTHMRCTTPSVVSVANKGEYERLRSRRENVNVRL